MKIKHVYGNVLRIDIPLTIKIINSESGETHEVEEPFYPDTSKPVLVELANQYNITKYTYEATVDGNVAHIEDYGNVRVGVYKVTVKCFDEYNQPYRYMVRDIIEICDATIDAGVEAGIEFDSETYTLEGAYFIKGEKGDKGDDGITPHIDETTGDWFVGDEDTGVHAQGERGEQGEQGDKGDTGEGVAAGGTTGQVLQKKSNTDFDTEWTTVLKGFYKVITVTQSEIATEVPKEGTEIDVIYVNGSNDSIEITIKETLQQKTPTGEDLIIYVPTNGYAEANYSNIGGLVFVRGV